MPPLAFLSR